MNEHQEETFDVIVLGGGPAGEVAGEYAVRGTSLTCALVESALLGGECSYWACMPSKALLRPLEVAGAANHLQGLTGTQVQVPALLGRRDTWRSHLDDSGQASWAKGAGLTVVRGQGRLAGPRTVEVSTPTGTRRLTARVAVVLATGSAPSIPGSLQGVNPWTSRDATGVVEVPDRLAIVGGGVVACEAATWLSALGSKVTMLVRGDSLLGSFEPFAGEAVAKELRSSGVEVCTGSTVEAATRADPTSGGDVGHLHGGPVTLTVGGQSLEVDEVLVATGRRPNLAEVGLDTVGLAPDDLTGALEVVDGWLYAVGDVGGGPKLTHWGKYQARQVGAMIAAHHRGTAVPQAPDEVPVPQVVFSQPQVASVGPTLEQARAAGRQVRAVDQDLGSAAGWGLLRDDASGRARLVIEGDRIIGATFVGQEVAELLHAATIAIVGGVPVDRLAHAVAAYPTASEIWLSLVEAALDTRTPE